MRVRYVCVGKNIPANQRNNHRRPQEVLAREVVRVSDIILEVMDARFLDETRNAELEAEIKAKGKKIIYIVNKVDLIDVKALFASGKLKDLRPYVLISCKKNIGRKRLRDVIKIEVKRLRRENSLILRNLKAGILDIPGKEKEQIIKIDKRAHVGIIGYPNTGKSTLINVLAGGGAANAAPESGFTKGIQKIRFSKDILILDSPGLIPEKENLFVNSTDIKKHAKIGAKGFDKTKEPEFVVGEIMKEFPDKIEKFYQVVSDGDPELLIETLGRRWSYLLKGNTIDTDRTARRILKDWQCGNIK